ncbi:unnamed protein product [Calypogeia fissa]
MSDAESIDLKPEEEVDVEEGKWKSTSSSDDRRSSTSSSPDLTTEVVDVPAGSPLHRWVDAELISFLNRTIMTSSSARTAHHDDDYSEEDEEDFGRYSQTMLVAESVVDVDGGTGEESRVIIDGELRTYDLSTQNLSYKINVRQRGQVVGQKVLLNNITAEARHGEVMAIMGPSGASKTTYLDALAGRISRKSLTGSVFVNGLPMTDKFRRVSGYVMQDDVHFPYLTARETLMYSARLRIPSSVSMDEKKRRVEAILEILGLKTCADTRIGNEEVGGVSGGERRRISIALDLIHDPMVLFLDEPTSGLDSTSALQVMQCLQKLAKERSRTIILSVHQPSYRILETIDNTLVLAKGNVIYQGHHTDMIEFFASQGFQKPEHVNVVEYLMDKIDESKDDLEKLKPKQPVTRSQSSQARRPMSSYDYNVAAIEDSTPATETETMMPEDQPGPGDLGPAAEHTVKFANPFWKETWVLSSRNFYNFLRTKTVFVSRIATVLLTGLIMATLFFNSDKDEEGLRDRQVFFSFTIAILVFTSTEAMPVFLMERRIFIRETSRGAYRASSYVVSYSIIVLPFMLVLAVLSTVTSYFAVGLVRKTGAILFFALVVFLILSIANAFVAFISGVAPNFITGLIAFGATSAYQFLFCGFFIRRHDIPKYWIWLHYGSFFKYAYEALVVNEFRNIRGHIWFRGLTSERLLHRMDMKRDMSNQWLNVFVLICFFLGFRFLFYLTLRFQTTNIRK